MSGSVFAASSFFHELITSKNIMLPSISHEKLQSKNQTIEYADFSGYWTGQCSLNGVPGYFTEFTIENDASYIAINDYVRGIGSLKTESSSAAIAPKNSQPDAVHHIAIEWNKEMSKLTLKGVDFVRNVATYPYNQSIPVKTTLGKFTFSLQNGELVIEGQSIAFEDLKLIDRENIKTHCILNKK